MRASVWRIDPKDWREGTFAPCAGCGNTTDPTEESAFWAQKGGREVAVCERCASGLAGLRALLDLIEAGVVIVEEK